METWNVTVIVKDQWSAWAVIKTVKAYDQKMAYEKARSMVISEGRNEVLGMVKAWILKTSN